MHGVFASRNDETRTANADHLFSPTSTLVFLGWVDDGHPDKRLLLGQAVWQTCIPLAFQDSTRVHMYGGSSGC